MSEKKPIHIVLSAGEASGDMHAAALVEAILNENEPVVCSGMGGGLMAQAGVNRVVGIEKTGVVGLWEVLSHGKSVVEAYRKLGAHLRESRPDLFIPVDYPDFNLRMSARARALGIPVIYYISPQLWAWRSGRVREIKKNVDRMIVILPFEQEWYRAHGLDVDYVGHPLVDTLAERPSRKDARTAFEIPGDQLLITFMPGSRKSEIRVLYPVIRRTAELIHDRYPNAVFTLLLAPTLTIQDLREAGYADDLIGIRASGHRAFLSASDLVITASGTATIEAALSRVPMIVIYKVAPLTYWIGKKIIRTPHIGMVNLIAGKRIVPELIQDQATPQKIARETLHIIGDPAKQAEIIAALDQVRKKLGPPGAPQRAARSILDFLRTRITDKEKLS